MLIAANTCIPDWLREFITVLLIRGGISINQPTNQPMALTQIALIKHAVWLIFKLSHTLRGAWTQVANEMCVCFQYTEPGGLSSASTGIDVLVQNYARLQILDL